uniref:Uncharacterized protein n=1 Tax=Thermogemmatispora argillosa TaxID=2045280 RepID=A0A455SXF9_9CHLR|nr:hypothetical protein KTA_05590 [Thermogemmatispora argillosa]
MLKKRRFEEPGLNGSPSAFGVLALGMVRCHDFSTVPRRLCRQPINEQIENSIGGRKRTPPTASLAA